MSKLTHSAGIVSALILISIVTVLACGSPSTVTETLSEAEIQEEFAAEGLEADLQPGKIVLSGEAEGMTIDLEMTMKAVDGAVVVQITKVMVDGTDMPVDMFEDMGTQMSDTIYHPDEGYVVESVEITDTEITFTSVRQ